MEKKYVDLIIKDLSGEISEDEMNELKAWLPGNEKVYNEFRNIWEKSFSIEELDIDENSGWNKLQSRIQTSEYKKRKFWSPVFLRIAASLLLILSIAFVLQQMYGVKNNTISTSNHVEIFYLPDSTQVWLNQNSSLSIEHFGPYDRKVKLVGEAYFKVKKDPKRPFVIEAGNSVTKVLGTEFDLKAYPDSNVEIHVESGVVEFRSLEEKKKSIFLLKNQKAVLVSGTGEVRKAAKEYKEDKWLAASEPMKKPEILNEISKPISYLHNGYRWKDNIVRQVIIEGRVRNEAVFTSYKNIEIKATYYTDDNNKVGIEYHSIDKDLKPGEEIKYKFRLGNWFKKASRVDVEICNAHSIK